MKAPKVDTSGTEKAQKAIADAQAAATNLQKNFAADLKTENITQVTPGGTAEAQDMVSGMRKKRPAAGGLASQLGINV
jgi:hypothetical protein